MEEQIVVEGTVENIIYHNSENSYTVFSVTMDKDNGKEVELVCVGYVPVINIGESIHIMGTVVTHPTYGEQIQIEIYEKTPPKTEKGIEKYLASGLIKGIGKKLAKRIVDKFGIETINIITYYLKDWQR